MPLPLAPGSEVGGQVAGNVEQTDQNQANVIATVTLNANGQIYYSLKILNI